MAEQSLSIIGRIFYNTDKQIFDNFKLFISKHSYSIEVIFLLVYSILQIGLSISILLFNKYTPFIISLFIVLFLGAVALEKLAIQFKSKQSQIETTEAKKKYFELKMENEKLREGKRELIKEMEEKIPFFIKDKRLKH